MQRLLLWMQLITVMSHGAVVGNPFIKHQTSPLVKKEGLYSSMDDVIILNNKNMKERVYGKNKVWVVEFYNSWCGHCIHFAPTWRQFASDLKGWRRVVSVGAVDCANDANLKICRDFDIDSYPSVLLLPPDYKDDDRSADLVKFVKSQEKVEMKESVLKYISDARFPTPSTWPRLKPLASLGDIWEYVKDEHTYVVVVFEEEKSIVGREVILDLVDYPDILVQTMLRKDVEKFRILKYPSLYIINKDSTFKHLASGTGMLNADRHRFTDTLLSMLGMFDSQGRRIKVNHNALDPVNAAEKDLVVQLQQPEGTVAIKAATNISAKAQVHMQDLESALHYAFRQEIAICKTIDGPRLDALRGFLSALAKFFPGRAAVSRFLRRLVDYLGAVDSHLTGESWLTAIDSLQDKEAFLPSTVRWLGCQGSLPRYRGYPCSMWTLFHTMTVTAFQSSGDVNALEVPLAIRGYMEHFFGCRECSQNFLKMASTVEQEVHSRRDAVLWLWAAHNKANARLHGDASEDPVHPKVQFPTLTDCPECRVGPSSGPTSYADLADPGWDRDAVARYLGKLYGRHTILPDATGRGGGGGGGDSASSSSAEEEATPSSASRGEAPGEELDWWEKRQRQADLRNLRDLRQRKKEKRRRNLVLGEVGGGGKGKGEEKRLPVVDSADQAHEGKKRAVVDAEGEEEGEGGGWRRGRQLGLKVRGGRVGGGWAGREGVSQVDLGVCMAFYLACAALIVLLYYHFIVTKRFKLPCANYLPR